MAESPIPFGRALLVNPSTAVDIHDVKIDVSVAVRCQCGGPKTILITRLTQPAPCPSCGRPYLVQAVQVTPTTPGNFEISVGVAPGLLPTPVPADVRDN